MADEMVIHGMISEHVLQAVRKYADALHKRSRLIVTALDMRMETLIVGWLAVFMLAASPRILFPLSPVRSVTDFIAIALPYCLIAMAPIAGYRLAAGSFPRGFISAQPSIRLAIYGRWRKLSVMEARSHRDFGPTGFMASLLIGMMLNVPVRSFEFLLSVPSMNFHAPTWGTTIFHMMALDVIVMSFLYMVCFVMALRSIPFFPRMLGLAWLMDITFQLAIAQQVSAAPHLPAEVGRAMLSMLESNVKKVLISVFVWLPYLLLSQRVNVTYRNRTAA